MKRILAWACIPGIVLLLLPTLPALAQGSSAADSARSLPRHDPYDLSQAAAVDSHDVYVSRTNHLLALPRYTWSALVYPLGEFTIYTEHARLVTRYTEFFTNEAGTFGLFPQFQIGGETGAGGGVRIFHTDLAGKGKRFEGLYVYSGGRGQMGGGLYLDPNLFGSRLTWKVQGGYLRTRNRSANINAAVRADSTRLFQIEQVDAETALEWRLQTGKWVYFRRNVTVEARFGYGRRDFQAWLGGGGPSSDPGSTPEAQMLRGLGQTFDLYRFGGRIAYDDRDYREPARELSHPLNYKLPGRIVLPAEGLFYFYRDLGYPERGGLFAVEGEWVTGSNGVRFYRFTAEAQRFVTLFWRDRILAVRGRLEKVNRAGGGTIPYTELAQLGGSSQMRGYRRGTFRGRGGLLLNLEYRYPIWDTWNAFLFWDEGQIFDRFGNIGWDGFRSSWGGGIAFRTELGLLGKLQVGHSAVENVLIGFVLGQGF